MNAQSKTVSLALGSGGARGLAHIGVIRWLTENGYTIRSIAGSSMGALIGGIYAAGKLEVYASWVLALERLDVLRLLDFAFGQPALFKGERIMGVLRELIGDSAIEDLPVAFTAVASDLATGDEVLLREGSLFDAIRASIATPLIFTPFERGGRTLLDGGLVNPVPTSALQAEATNFSIAVSLSGHAEPSLHPEHSPVLEPDGYKARIRAFIESLHVPRAPVPEPRGMVDIAFRTMDVMEHAIARLRLDASPPELMVEIPRNACGYLEFWRASELIALGHERAGRTFAVRGH